MDKKCSCDMCNIDLSNDNGYKYVLDELRATRAQIDNIIKVIEKRIEKDAIINEVLNTDYDDEEEVAKEEKDDTTLDAIIKAIAISNAMNGIGKNNKHVYPWWSTYPKNMWLY